MKRWTSSRYLNNILLKRYRKGHNSLISVSLDWPSTDGNHILLYLEEFAMKLDLKLILSFLVVGLLPLAILGSVSWWVSTGALDSVETRGSTALEDGAFQQLEKLRDIKTNQINQYFSERKGDMGVLSDVVDVLRAEAYRKLGAIRDIKLQNIRSWFEDRINDTENLSRIPSTLKAIEDLDRAYPASGGRAAGIKPTGNGGFVATDEYKKVHDAIFPFFESYMNQYGYYDIFLLRAENGDVMFTVTKEPDFATRLADEKHGLAEAWKSAMKSKGVVLTDMAPYAPSNGAPAQFLAKKVLDSSGKVVGVVALQISSAKMKAVMSDLSGLGRTGESYLVGPDKLMRSDSRLDPKNHSLEASFANPKMGRVDTEAVKMALNGKKGQEVIEDYNGNLVLSAFAPLKVGGLNWAVLVEIDIAEAFSPVDDEGIEFYKEYIEKYGYYDLFLIAPNGHCFYTVARESDYNTNLLNGKWMDSGLGELTRQVLQTNEFGFADFAPYGPSNNEPASFIAQPVKNRNGKTIMVVALQISLEGINKMIAQGSDKEQTLECYLVGSDYLMRTDSILDPQHHSVKASFANPSKGSVTWQGKPTKALSKALSGETGSEVITDYNGSPVLSAYAPIDVYGTRWALLCEVDEKVAMEAKNEMQETGLQAERSMMFWTGVIATLVAIVVGITAWMIANGISKPILKIITGLRSGSEEVASASSQISTSSQALAAGASQQAASIEQVSASLEEITSMISQTADNTKEAEGLAGAALSDAKEGLERMSRMSRAIDSIDKSSEQTAQIIETVNEIAFQTNLLAINAAVEAARAGEAGKGFAVVADEVRNLATRCAEAARNIANLIDESRKHSGEGVKANDLLHESLEAITANVQRLGDLMREISSASREQSEGIGQISKAITDIDKATQQTAANSEELAAGSEELNSQSESMDESVETLSKIIEGQSVGSERKQPSLPEGYATRQERMLQEKKKSMPQNKMEQRRRRNDDFKEF